MSGPYINNYYHKTLLIIITIIITKCDGLLLQDVTSVITKCDRYYKVQRLLKSARQQRF